jgi:hypothetical protein
MIAAAEAVEPKTGRFVLTWVVEGGTGRLAGIHGEGVVNESFDFTKPRRSISGDMTGYIRVS